MRAFSPDRDCFDSVSVHCVLTAPGLLYSNPSVVLISAYLVFKMSGVASQHAGHSSQVRCSSRSAPRKMWFACYVISCARYAMPMCIQRLSVSRLHEQVRLEIGKRRRCARAPCADRPVSNKKFVCTLLIPRKAYDSAIRNS